MQIKPSLFRRIMNLWAPFRGAGIWVEYIAPDWCEVRVRLSLHWYNKNAMGTHFGGSLFAVTDPFFMLMYMGALGRKQYIVWDQAASIRFMKPGTGVVRAQFLLTPEDLAAAREATADGNKYLPEHTVQLFNSNQEVIAEVHKTLYIRQKRRSQAERTAS